MNVKILKAVIMAAVVVLCTGSLAHVSEAADTEQVTGEIVGIDLERGTLQLKSDATQGKGEITEYKIDQNENRIMNSSDKRLLSIKDLQPGQHVTVDIINGDAGQTVKKIVVDPGPAYDHADEKAKFKRSGEAFNSKENKKFRAKMQAEEKKEEAAEEKKKDEDAQDKGEGQVKVKF